jgi:hypothetical protein
MKNKANYIKKLVKGKETFGTNPMDPWSTKAGLAESALDKYLLSRGIDPRFVSTNQKVAHSKSTQFQKWMQDRKVEEYVPEDVGHMATQSAGGKTKERASSLTKTISAYKEVKTPHGPGSRHESKSQMSQLTPEETQTPQEKFKSGLKKSGYDPDKGAKRLTDLIAKQKKDREEHEKKYGHLYAKEETEKLKVAPNTSKGQTSNPYKKDNKLVSAPIKKEEAEIEEGLLDFMKKSSKKQDAIHYIKVNNALKTTPSGKHIMKFPDRESAEKHANEHKKKNPSHTVKVTTDKGTEDPTWHGGTKTRAYSYGMREDKYQDPAAPTQTVGMEIEDRMSKSAKMIKSIYKNKKMVKEDLYDHEKEDKSVATYGKKPKFEKADKDDSTGEKKPSAAAVVSGGTTLTGQGRDTVEIDPSMRVRPGQPDPTKKDEKKKEEKKEDKKDK